jgi:hypothetical protein
MDLSPSAIKLIAEGTKKAADDFVERGCHDLEQSLVDTLTDEEWKCLLKTLTVYNGSDDPEDVYESPTQVGSDLLTYVAVHILEKYAEEISQAIKE